MARFETEPLSIFEKWNQKTTNGANKSLKFIVKWIFPKIVIQVPYQMDEAPLLLTRQRIVPSIKVRYDCALERREQRLQKLRFTVRAQPENHTNIVSQDPYVLVCPGDVYLCFIKMQDRGLCLVRVSVPAGLAPGPQPIQVSAGGSNSPPSLKMTIGARN